MGAHRPRTILCSRPVPCHEVVSVPYTLDNCAGSARLLFAPHALSTCPVPAQNLDHPQAAGRPAAAVSRGVLRLATYALAGGLLSTAGTVYARAGGALPRPHWNPTDSCPAFGGSRHRLGRHATTRLQPITSIVPVNSFRIVFVRSSACWIAHV